MTDEQLRAADPYRPGLAAKLDGAEQSLLEEIMSADPVPSAGRRWLVAVAAAAAVLIGAVAVSVVVRHHSAGQLNPVAPAPSPSRPAVVTPPQKPEPAATPTGPPSPLLLVDQPGWKGIHFENLYQGDGTAYFTKGKLTLEITWFAAGEYAARRAGDGTPVEYQPGSIAGLPGDIFTIAPKNFAIMLKPHGDYFLELQTGGPFTMASFKDLLKHLKQVSLKTWLAAMPGGNVTPEQAQQKLATALAGVPLPPEITTASFANVAVNDDQYEYDAEVMTVVGCGWIAEYERATATHRTAEQQRAVDAMTGSRHWKVFTSLGGAGGAYPQVFWQIADDMAAGKPLQQDKLGIGCH